MSWPHLGELDAVGDQVHQNSSDSSFVRLDPPPLKSFVAYQLAVPSERGTTSKHLLAETNVRHDLNPLQCLPLVVLEDFRALRAVRGAIVTSNRFLGSLCTCSGADPASLHYEGSPGYALFYDACILKLTSLVDEQCKVESKPCRQLIGFPANGPLAYLTGWTLYR